MSFSDKNLGIFGLIMSSLFLGYLLLRLIVLPILPLEDDDIFKLNTPVALLLILAMLGFIFIGLLSLHIVYVLHTGNIRFKRRREMNTHM